MTKHDQAEFTAALLDNPLTSGFHEAYFEHGLHKIDGDGLRARLSKHISDPKLLNDSLRLTQTMSPKDLRSTVLSMFANPSNTLSTPVMSTVLMMLQQIGVSAKQAQIWINDFFGDTLLLSYGKTSDQLHDYDGVMVTKFVTKDGRPIFVCDGVNADDKPSAPPSPPASVVTANDDDVSETVVSLPVRSGNWWQRLKSWVSGIFSGGGGGKSMSDILGELFGGTMTGAQYGTFIMTPIGGVSGLVIGGAIGMIGGPEAALAGAATGGTIGAIVAGASGAVVGGAAGFLWTAGGMLTGTNVMADPEGRGDDRGSIPDNWPFPMGPQTDRDTSDLSTHRI